MLHFHLITSSYTSLFSNSGSNLRLEDVERPQKLSRFGLPFKNNKLVESPSKKPQRVSEIGNMTVSNLKDDRFNSTKYGPREKHQPDISFSQEKKSFAAMVISFQLRPSWMNRKSPESISPQNGDPLKQTHKVPFLPLISMQK
jgi:hypothetical protein